MTQKNKNILLVAGLLLLWGIAYIFGFSKTIALSTHINELQQQKKIHQSAPAQLAALAKKEKQLDAILAKNKVAGSSIQNNLLKTLQEVSEATSVMVVNFDTPHILTDTETNKVTTTYQFTLEGDYKSLRNVIYALEQQYSFGNIIHAHFEKQKNYRTRVTYLQCKLLVQRVN
ncbi:hypothetical protein [Aquimarina brevivitae]|uniref:Type IV pilus assembly protein PilO n=1 Tax=Aquimarina brevivitae TaxID=323412 RepID=A0A4Q7NY21_9FLAO|nr:hypothetical protein [Aquimarina brevivitae]RZS92316.1 hypothetical protein EV197_2954 [Aquimarina brevivitae]